MTATICIPWRGGPGREEIREQVIKFYTLHLPEYPIVYADSGHPEFNRAASRNRAVDKATTDIVIVLDADTFVHPERMRAAVEAAQYGGLHYPFTIFCPIELDTVPHLFDLRFPTARRGWRATGGVFITSKQTWWELGGQDENFLGWGGEDDAFFTVASTLSYVTRQPGVVCPVNHDAQRRDECPHWEQSGQRMDVYRALRRHPDLMSEFIRTHDVEPYLDLAHRRGRASQPTATR